MSKTSIVVFLFIISLNISAKVNGIIGPITWQEVSALSDNNQAKVISQYVYEIINEHRENCQATNIYRNTLITANHCVYGKMNLITGPKCTVSRIISAKDIAYLNCDIIPVKNPITTSDLITKDVYLIEWQCDWRKDPTCKNTLKYAPGEAYARGGFVYHNANTLPGSSGAPIFNDHNELIGIHTNGGDIINSGSAL